MKLMLQEDIDYWNWCKIMSAGDRYEIDGINIWAHQWVYTDKYFQKKIPGGPRGECFSIYEILPGEKKITFAAAEVSNLVYMILSHYG